MTFDLRRRAVAEGMGTAALVAAVVGSGIMADRLTDDAALALLCNALATGAMLMVLITTLGPVSGAQMNPIVTLMLRWQRQITARDALSLIAAQMAGGVAGVWIAHAMFGLPVLTFSGTIRTGPGQWLAEGVATFGLIATIMAGARLRAEALPWLVGLYITAAYWFTASTSFANPAVTLARSLTGSFAGIRPVDAPAFILAQALGGILAVAVMTWLLHPAPQRN